MNHFILQPESGAKATSNLLLPVFLVLALTTWGFPCNGGGLRAQETAEPSGFHNTEQKGSIQPGEKTVTESATDRRERKRQEREERKAKRLQEKRLEEEQKRRFGLELLHRSLNTPENNRASKNSGEWSMDYSYGSGSGASMLPQSPRSFLQFVFIGVMPDTDPLYQYVSLKAVSGQKKTSYEEIHFMNTYRYGHLGIKMGINSSYARNETKGPGTSLLTYWGIMAYPKMLEIVDSNPMIQDGGFAMRLIYWSAYLQASRAMRESGGTSTPLYEIGPILYLFNDHTPVNPYLNPGFGLSYGNPDRSITRPFIRAGVRFLMEDFYVFFEYEGAIRYDEKYSTVISSRENGLRFGSGFIY